MMFSFAKTIANAVEAVHNCLYGTIVAGCIDKQQFRLSALNSAHLDIV